MDAGFLQDPYPTYRAWRESTPVHWSTAFSGGAWVVTRHADVEQVLRDPSFSARRTGGWIRAGAAERRSLHGFQRIFARAMLFLDAPDHGRLRSALHAAFRPAVLQAAPVIVDAYVMKRKWPSLLIAEITFMRQGELDTSIVAGSPTGA